MNKTYCELLIEEFNTILDSTKKKLNLIELEIKLIDQYSIMSPKIPSSYFNTTIYRPKSVVDLTIIPINIFQKVFHGYQLNDEIIFTYDETDPWTNNEQYQTAGEITKYYIWLKEIKSEYSLKKPKAKNSKLTLHQKVLALHYLGLDLRKYDKTKSSKILSQIIGENESNTRKSFSYINSATQEDKIKNKQNLKILLELFENEQFGSINNEIKDDLEKVEVSG